MKVLVTGPRTWGVIPQGTSDVGSRAAQARAEADLLKAVLDDLEPSSVVHGGCAGADTWAGLWATAKGVPQKRIPAPFAYLGPGAGPLRNTYMLVHHRPDLVLACGPAGDGGTDNTVSTAQLMGIPVKRITT